MSLATDHRSVLADHIEIVTASLNFSMTTEQYTEAYAAGFDRTVNLLLKRGVRWKEDAQDYAQSAWLKAWAKHDTFRGECKIQTWINIIALHEYYSAVRRNTPDSHAVSVEIDTDTVPLHGQPTCEINTDAIDCRRLLGLVAPRDAQILREFYVDGYTGPELRRRYGKNRNTTIHIRLFRAAARVRAQCQR